MMKSIFLCFITSLFLLLKLPLLANDSLLFSSKFYSDIKNSRVVLLGEPTHGEGNVIEVKSQIVKMLVEEFNFNTIALEGSFYELHKINSIKDSVIRREEFIKAIFPIWGKSLEFQGLIEYVAKKPNVKIIGFDFQFNNAHPDSVLKDLESHMEQMCKESRSIYNKVLKSIMLNGKIAHSIESELPLFYAISDSLFSKESVDNERFVRQLIKNIHNLVKWYDNVNPNSKSNEEWVAKYSNGRDRQMADNLSFYLNGGKDSKIVAWGASTHFAKTTQSLNKRELKEYFPMGSYLSNELGKGDVFSIATLAGGGEFGAWFESSEQLILSQNSFEKKIMNHLDDICYISSDTFPSNACLSAMENKVLCGSWNAVFDGFIFFPEYVKSHWVKSSEVVRKKEFRVYDEESKMPIIGAHVSYLDSVVGVSSFEGVVEVEVSRIPSTIKVNSIGYQSATFNVSSISDTIFLNPRLYDLKEITVFGDYIPPEKIMIRVIDSLNKARKWIPVDEASIKVNCELKYLDSTISKSIGNYYYDINKNYDLLKKDNILVVKPPERPFFNVHGIPNIKWTSSINKVLTHPILQKKSKLRLYEFKYEKGTKDIIVIFFKSKKNNRRATEHNYVKNYEGKIYIDRESYLVVRFEAYTNYDLGILNEFARDDYKKKGQRSLFKKLHELRLTEEVSDYKFIIRDGVKKYFLSSFLHRHYDSGVLLSDESTPYEFETIVKGIQIH